MDSLDTETPAEQKAFSVEDAKDELALLVDSGRVTAQEVSALQAMIREIVAGKEKVSKLKSLLGRSAKAQRETKVESEQTLKRLKEAEKQIERLEAKVTALNTRPTHMELLQDFETNFDRALVNVDRQASQKSLQAGGQDTAPPPLMENMLLQELAEARSRIESLETLRTSLTQNSQNIEANAKSIRQENETLQHSIKTLQLELKMAQMEASHANQELQHSERSLQEMQLEIDLLTKNNLNSVKNQAMSQSNSRQVQQLQSQVSALQEWALASAEAKSLAMEHVRMLEKRLREHDGVNGGSETVLWSKTSSFVVGAADVGFVVLEEEDEHALLRWQFDCVPQDVSVDFSVLKGVCDTRAKQSQADCLIKERPVTGGAAGELEAAFAIQNACTLVWSNTKSWVRPRTVTYTVDAVALLE